MIVFDLRCETGHVFEAWFGSSGDYEAQRARGLVRCPVCDDADVRKAAMAPRLNSGAVEQPSLPVAAPGPGPGEMKAVLAKMAALQAKLVAGSNWVGSRFAEEARSMHFGETDTRPIHGQATAAQAAALVDDGIAVTPLPFPITPPESSN